MTTFPAKVFLVVDLKTLIFTFSAYIILSSINAKRVIFFSFSIKLVLLESVFMHVFHLHWLSFDVLQWS